MKLKKGLTLLLAVFFILTSACSNETASKNNSEVNGISEIPAVQAIVKPSNLNKYDINVVLNPDNKTLSGYENISYLNSETTDLKELYFHLYPNAFKSKDTAPFLFDDFNNAYPLGFKPGSIDIHEITSNGKNFDFTISGKGSTILNIKLKEALKPKEHIDLTIKFTINIPPAGERFGYTNDSFNFGNWYPIAAVYDDTGWNLDPYYSIGDPFYSDVSDYNVKITVPKDYIVASTGEILEEKTQGNMKTYSIAETSVRDFAWSASNKFILKESTVDGIKIKSYCFKEYPDGNDRALAFAESAIRIYNKYYGKYPNKTYSVVGTTFPSGMEYPGIVFINIDYYKDARFKSILDIVITHETAHQWWYAAVGNDEIDEAWLDESMATYSEALYFESKYDKDTGESYFNDRILAAYNANDSLFRDNKIVLKPLSEFKDWNDYGPLVYNKGAIMLDTIRTKVGDESFFNIMRSYYKDYMFKNATTDDFIETVEEVTGNQWDSFFDEWLLDKK